jgi:hypothetical protein
MAAASAPMIPFYVSAATCAELMKYATKPWFEELCTLFRLDPERLTRSGESYLFEAWEETQEELDALGVDLSRGYALDRVENPVLHFCVRVGGKMHKYYLDSTSVFESDYPKMLNLDARKWTPGNYELWSQLRSLGHTCNIYHRVVRLPWLQVNRAITPLLREGYLCKVEFVSPRAHHADDDRGALLRRVMDSVRYILKQEEEKEEEQEGKGGTDEEPLDADDLYALAERRVRAGCYQYLRGYLYQPSKCAASRAGQRPGCKSFVDADLWAAARGGVKAQAGCVVHVPTACIRAVTVRNIKYIVSDFVLA